MYRATVSAVSASVHCRNTAGSSVFTTAPAGLYTLEINFGSIIAPPLAIAPAIMAMCSGVTCVVPCPKPA